MCKIGQNAKVQTVECNGVGKDIFRFDVGHDYYDIVECDILINLVKQINKIPPEQEQNGYFHCANQIDSMDIADSLSKTQKMHCKQLLKGQSRDVSKRCSTRRG